MLLYLHLRLVGINHVRSIVERDLAHNPILKIHYMTGLSIIIVKYYSPKH